MSLLHTTITTRHIGDLLSPLGWFTYLRQQLGKAMIWEDGLGKYAFVGAKPICTISKRGNTLIKEDHLSAQTERVEVAPFDAAAIENQLLNWVAAYEIEAEYIEYLTWWGYQSVCNLGKEDMYYQLYAYNFIFDYTTGIMKNIQLYQTGENPNAIAELWSSSSLVKAWDFEPLYLNGDWKAKISESTWEEQLQASKNLIESQYISALQSTRIWQNTYTGDIFQLYRAMRKQPKNQRGKYCFFLDAGHFQWMGEGGLEAFYLPLKGMNINKAEGTEFPSPKQIGYPVEEAQIYLMAQSKQGYFSLDLVKFNMMENHSKQQSIERAFLTVQGHTLYAFTQQLLDSTTDLAQIKARHQMQYDFIEKISQDIVVF